jgi:hydrogenase maturation protease
MSRQRILVLGIGNLLMGDEGVGVHAVRCLDQDQLPPAVTVVDGGTGGTVGVARPRYASDFPRALTAHDIGLRDLVESAVLLGPLPPIHLVTVSIAELSGLSLDLSPPVHAALPRVVAVVRELVMAGDAAAPAEGGATKAAGGHA